jgi:hypothetical protein
VDDAGWTVDGPDRALGVQLKGLSVSRGGKRILEVRVESIHDVEYRQITVDVGYC